YLIFVTNQWETGAGWCLNYQAITDPVYCLGTQTLTAVSGTITDGSGANNYYDNASCCWRIRPTGVQEGVLELNFTEFGLSNEDTLYLYDGPDSGSPLLGAFTGTTLPGTFFATNRVLYLCLDSNPGATGPGFAADWNIRYCIAEQHLEGASGTLSDGSGWGYYLPGTDCCWLIDAGEGEGELVFKFDGYSTELDGDTIFVYDGETTDAPLLGAFSGYMDWPAPTLYPTSNRFLVCFRSDDDAAVEDGFRARWYRQFCSGTDILTETQGSFCDGSGANNYPAGTECSWLIHVEGATHIILDFSEFNVSFDDWIEIFDNAQGMWPSLYTFSGWQIPTEPIAILGDTVLVRFVASAWGTGGQGWCVNYTASFDPIYCLGTTIYNQSTGTVTDGSGPNDYLNNTNCCWRIAPWFWEGQLQLTFTEFNLAPGDTLTIWDGNPQWGGGTLVGKFTG
ncbi:MAG: CUB domain-containing protein, partial [Bacteroidia bacterium]|nr:CUB domain-containing protein [Bacteroidia bacterium]